jgi:sulfoxide reductase heme-binding subunit YedZ
VAEAGEITECTDLECGMSKAIGSWRLFWALALANSAAVLVALPFAEFDSVEGPLFMIRHAVRCALPLFLLAFAASSLATFWPNQSTRWLLSNRRYFGLAFAFGMAWQLVFIGWLAVTHFAYFVPRAVNLNTFIGGVIPYLLLLVMTLTSFRRFGRYFSVRNWRRVHKTGMYVFWFGITSSYATLYVAPAASGLNVFRCVVLSLFLWAWVLRIAAWARRQLLRRSRTNQSLATNRPTKATVRDG